MCSSSEATSRETDVELSSFESTLLTSSTSTKNRHRVLDPSLCIKKYRRSAAGGGVSTYDDSSTTRSTDDLLQTVRHVVYNIFCRRRLAGKFDFRQHNHTLCVVSGFASDRLRGVSVDVVQNQYANAAVQTLEDLERTFEILR